MPAPAEPIPPRRREPEAGIRAVKVPEVVFCLRAHGLQGDLRFNQRGFIRCHCDIHGEQCRRQRQTTAGRLGAGRPIGSLICWLRHAHEQPDKANHVVERPASHAERTSARDWFKQLPGATEFLAFERAKAAIEDEEPRYIP